MYRKEPQSLNKRAFQHHYQYTTHRTGSSALLRLWIINLRSHLVTSLSRNPTEEEGLALVSKCQNESVGRLERKRKKREPTQIRGPGSDPPCEDQFSPLNYEHVQNMSEHFSPRRRLIIANTH